MLKWLQEGLYTQIEYSSVAMAVVGTVGIALLCMVIPYLLGSVNTAVLVSRLLYHDDIRRHGSGNAGLTNMLRTYGKVGALLTLLGDVLKTLLSIFIGGLLMGLQYYGSFSLGYGGYLAAMFCVMGHVFPIYYRFKGGKGVLCSATVVAALSPIVFCILLLVFVGLVALTKYVSLGSVMSALTYPLFYFMLFKVMFQGSTPPFYVVLFTFAIAAFLVWLHRANIERLRKGEEHKLSFSKHSVDTSHTSGEGEDK